MRVKKVDYIEGYKLKVLFNDNKTKVVDMGPIIIESKSVYFIPLKDIEFFKKVKLDDDQYPLSICWPNDADICPNVLYSMGEDIQEQEKQTQRESRRQIIVKKTQLKQQTSARTKRPSKKVKK